MESMNGNRPTRSKIAIRLLVTIFYLVVFELLKTIIQLCVFFQYVHLLVVRRHNEPVRHFSNRVVAYAYAVMRFITLGDNDRPFPFAEFPRDLEAPSDRVRFE